MNRTSPVLLSLLPSLLPSLLLALLLPMAACGNHGSKADANGAGGTKEEPPAPTNRVEIPAPVRSNLGITFAKVQRRQVAHVLRVPGRFELLPGARRGHHAPLDGRLELLVEQYQPVEPGTPLYRLDSPAWRAMQREIDDTGSTIAVAAARLESLAPLMEAHRMHEDGLRESVDLWTARVARLEEVMAAGGGQASELAEARARLTEARSAFGEVMEKDAELQVRRAELESGARAAAARLDLLLQSAATVLGVPRNEVDRPIGAEGQPLWRVTDRIEVRSEATGIVDSLSLTSGTWTKQGDPVLEVIDTTALRFRASALQSDLARLRSGLPAAIVPPQGGSMAADDFIATTVELAPGADPRRRTIDLLAAVTRSAPWAIAGVSAFLEVQTSGEVEAELAIPISAVVRDGATPVFFRRDPANPDRAIRMEADLGIDDGRWVVVHSGVRLGDEIVLDGAYQLLLATSGTMPRGGHFHADGTFHADDH